MEFSLEMLGAAIQPYYWLMLLFAGGAIGYWAGRSRVIAAQPQVDSALDVMQARTKHFMSVLIVSSIIFVASMAVLGVVDIKDATISALVIQVINTLKDIYRGPAAAYFGTPLEEHAQGTKPTVAVVQQSPPNSQPPPVAPADQAQRRD